jgi:hypothetical protein|tara:strand:+ start:815 stop:1261 length:447 start_codon:yes stop_codon:yes gene_type:complete
MSNSKSNDYLKYWRIIRYFIKNKYKLTTGELDMLLFLYSEEIFSRDKFNEYNQLLGWNNNRFISLKDRGWIDVFRKKTSRRKSLYQLSYKAQRVILSLYKKLNGEEIPTTANNNPLFARDVGYNHKVYRNMILEMNRAIKQQRHHALE